MSFKRLRASWIHDRYMGIQVFSSLFIELRPARIHVFILPYVSLRDCTYFFDDSELRCQVGVEGRETLQT